jgi:hypothetical protein
MLLGRADRVDAALLDPASVDARSGVALLRVPAVRVSHALGSGFNYEVGQACGGKKKQNI